MPGRIIGGGQLGTFELMDALRQHGFSPIALVNQANGDLFDVLKGSDVEYRYISGDPRLTKRDFARFVYQVFRIWRILTSEQISIIHLSDLSTAHYGIIAAKLAGICSIFHVKSLHFEGHLSPINKLILSMASRILAISGVVHQACLRAGLPAQKLLTIHDGLALKQFISKWDFSERSRQHLGISEGANVIGFVGRLGVEWKNEPLVYRISGELTKKMKNLTLLVIGGPHDGSQETFKKSVTLAKKICGKTDIRFLGLRNDVPKLLPAIDVLLVPSKDEPLGRVVIEGMAAGLPVIGSNTGGIPEMITNEYDGFLLPPNDLVGWLKITEKLLLEESLRSRIGKNAKKTVEKRFKLETMASKVANMYFEEI